MFKKNAFAILLRIPARRLPALPSIVPTSDLIYASLMVYMRKKAERKA